MISSPPPEALAPPPERLLLFEPDAARVRFLDQRMRRRLGDSLRHVFDQSEGHFSFSSEQAKAFLDRLDALPVEPLAFTFYLELVMAIDSDDLDLAARITEELLSLPAPNAGTVVETMPDPLIDANGARYSRFLDSDSSARFEVTPPTRAMDLRCRAQIERAFILLDKGAPTLAAETRALLRKIVLAAGTQAKGTYTFDGASAAMLWGCILINADRADTPLDMAQMLVHESAHNLIFGLAVDEPLLENDADERYASPLRPDARPLEGIYHATYVLARMHLVVDLLAKSGILSPDDQAKAERDRAQNRKLYLDGYATISRHARLTPLGARLLEYAHTYMTAA
jgi:hypothetical protein